MRITAYARHFVKAVGNGWVMTGINFNGIDLASGDETRRVIFRRHWTMHATAGNAGRSRRQARATDTPQY